MPLCPQTCIASCSINIPHQRETFVTVDEPASKHLITQSPSFILRLSDSPVGKESACIAGDPRGSIAGSGISLWIKDRLPTPVFLGFPFGSAGKESTCNAGNQGVIPGLGRSPGEGKGYPLQYSGMESTDCIVHGVVKSQTRLSNFQFHLVLCILLV